MKHRRTRLLHIITGLRLGGAETTLWRLMSRIDRDRFAVDVISLSGDGVVASMLGEIGITPRALQMRPGVPDPRALIRLRSWIQELRPDVIQTWLYHADLLGGVTGAALGIPVVWNLRQGDLSWRGNKLTTLLTAKSCAALSGWLPARIVSCSYAARVAHERLGYAREKFAVIPNGFDVKRFKPNPAARARIRCELGVSERTRLIGLVARFHVQKDHRNFFEACARIAVQENVHFLLCGDGIDWNNRALVAAVAAAGVADRCRLLGVRFDIPEVMSALDVAVSSSFGEGFPNVVGEAMACGVPCVATDVGDCAIMVGETGKVVPPGDPNALAGAVLELLALAPDARRRLGVAARRRIATRFDLSSVTRAYERMYRDVAGAGRRVPDAWECRILPIQGEPSACLPREVGQHKRIGVVRYSRSGKGSSQLLQGKEVDNEFVGTSS